MRRIVIWIASTVTVVVLLFGYHTSTSGTASAAGSSTSSTPPAGTSSGSSSSSSSSGSSSSSSGSSKSGSSSSGSSKSSGSSSSSSSATKTWTGSVASTRYGPVQVRITVTGGKVTKVDVLQSPSGNPRDVEIANRALPVLTQETISAQSAKIDMVSGATYTSEGYVSSLQSALDQAGI